jgi:hypothetical protein
MNINIPLPQILMIWILFMSLILFIMMGVDKRKLSYRFYVFLKKHSSLLQLSEVLPEVGLECSFFITRLNTGISK